MGVLCVEMFQREGDEPRLLVNEIAPRVHNSGHWTIDACPVSQFENHVRAICGWPLGEVGRHSDAVMTNLIGADVEALARRWPPSPIPPSTSTARRKPRPGRKMGHVTRLFPEELKREQAVWTTGRPFWYMGPRMRDLGVLARVIFGPAPIPKPTANRRSKARASRRSR